MIHRRRVALSVLVSLIVEAVNKVSPLLILYHAQKNLGVERFGYAQFGMTLVDFAIPFIIFGYNTVASIDLAANIHDGKKISKILSTLLSLKTAHAILAFGVIYALVHFVGHYQQYQPVFWALSFVFVFAALEFSPLHTATQSMMLLGLFTCMAKVLSLVLIVIWVKEPSDVLLYAVLVMAANSLVCFLTFIFGFKTYSLAKPDLAMLQDLFQKSIPFALVLGLLACLDRFDMVLANAFLGNVGAGLYAGPARIAQSLYSAMMAVAVVFFSEMVVVKDKDNFSKLTALAFWTLMALILPICGGIWFVDREVLQFIFGPEFLPVAPVLSVLTLSVFAHAVIAVFGFQVLMLRERASFVALSFLLALLIGVPMAWWLGKLWGLIGIALALVFTKSIAAGLIVTKARGFLTRLPVTEFFRILLPTLIMFAGLWLWGSSDIWQCLIVGVVLFTLSAMWFNKSYVRYLISYLRRS